MPIYGIIGILRVILAKYQFSSMRPSVLDKFYQITVDSLELSTWNILKHGFYGQNNQQQKNTKTVISQN